MNKYVFPPPLHSKNIFLTQISLIHLAKMYNISKEHYQIFVTSFGITTNRIRSTDTILTETISPNCISFILFEIHIMFLLFTHAAAVCTQTEGQGKTEWKHAFTFFTCQYIFIYIIPFCGTVICIKIWTGSFWKKCMWRFDIEQLETVRKCSY